MISVVAPTMNTARSVSKLGRTIQAWHTTARHNHLHTTTRPQTPFLAENLYNRRSTPRSTPPGGIKPSMPRSSHGFHNSSLCATEDNKRDSAIAHISIHIAASSSGKGTKFNPDKSTYDFQAPTPLGLQKQGSVYEKRRARPNSGEDAYFVAQIGSSHEPTSESSNTPAEIAFGVADGVGGWADQGVNPADFSHGLCSHAAETAVAWSLSNAGPNETSLHPKHLLSTAYDELLHDSQVRAGGSTACFATARSTGALKIANLGDSGFLHLRLGSVQAYSNPQTHAFNTPFQLSITPPEIMTQAAIFGGLPLNDPPERADVSNQDLRHGDVLVLATDGVWDNLSPQDILHLVSQRMRERGAWEKTDSGFVVTDKLSELVARGVQVEGGKVKTLQSELASEIVGEAKTASLDRKRDGPFAKSVMREYKDNPYERWRGGKIDDITALVIVSVEGQVEKKPLKAKL